MLSIILCSRVKDNLDSNFPGLLDSLVQFSSPEELARVEVLVKYDDDDDQRPPQDFFARYPFPVKTFQWSRGEGRHGLHNVQEQLFAHHDPRSTHCLFVADDFVFTRSGFVTDILSIRDSFAVIAPHRPPIEPFAGVYEEKVREWVVIGWQPLCPAVPVRLVEVCQNLGWQANVDSWLMALVIILYDLYKLDIWKTIPPYYKRDGFRGVGNDHPTYNDMELNCLNGPENRYWFELLRCQARNVYLNYHCGEKIILNWLLPK